MILFTKWRNLNEQLKLKDYLQKRQQNPRPTFLNDKVFYLKKQPKSEIKIIKKDINNLKSFAISSLIKIISNIFSYKTSYFMQKSQFLNNFIQKIKLKITLKNYGKNYKKIFNNLGIENFSNKQKNISLIRDAYKKYFSLQKIFLNIEKYNHNFSRFLKFFGYKIYIQGKLFNENININANNNNNNDNNLLEEKKNTKFLNFLNAKDAGVFKRKKFEALETLYANLQLNIYFTKWKLLMHKKFKEKIFNKKIILDFIEIIENIFLKNYQKIKEGDFNIDDKIEQKNYKYNQEIFFFNKDIHFFKINFFKKFLCKFSFVDLENNYIINDFNKKFQIFPLLKNIFDKKLFNFKKIFMRNFKIFFEEKNNNLKKLKKLKTIFEFVRLSNEQKVGKCKNLLNFIENYYTPRIFKQNTLAINFSKWRNKIIQSLNRIKLNEKFNIENYYKNSEKEINDNNNNEYFSLSPKGN
jgi:hypothetical protein